MGSTASTLSEACWPAHRLPEAIAALADHCGLPTAARGEPSRHGFDVGRTDPGESLGRLARELGIEAVPVESSYSQIEETLGRAAPAILMLPHVPGEDLGEAPVHPERGFLLLVGNDRRGLLLLAPDRSVMWVPLEPVRASLCLPTEGPAQADADRVLRAAGVTGRRQSRARRALLGQFLSEKRIGGCWLIRLPGQAGVLDQVREARLGRRLGLMIGSHACEYVLWILSWWVIGRFAFQGRLDSGWLWAWGLLLVSIIPFRLWTTYLGGSLSIRLGAILKRRLLHGALRMSPDEVRHLGAGGLLGRIMEADVVEMMALSGGFLGVTALVELAATAVVFGAAAGSAAHVLLLALVLAAAVAASLRLYRRTRQWTSQRVTMTNDLVERMMGHRTRLAQELRRHWNDGEDQRLESYLRASSRLDRLLVRLRVLLPRGWLILALLAALPAFMSREPDPVRLAIIVGGALLAYRAFHNLAEGMDRLATAAVASEQLAPLWRAAARDEPPGHPTAAGMLETTPAAAREGALLLEAHHLVFHYDQQKEPVLRGVSVTCRHGDRILLEGESGSGKSTLAALLAGGRSPSSGVLLLRGLDQRTVGAEGWRRRVVLVPQFHENHVLLGTFAFNVLLGRNWPPTREDLQEAEQVCRALGLGVLLDRMPGGMMQMVGETGWQLSHGEKSRLYLARALLQKGEVVVLDESFGALDAPTLLLSLRHVLESTPTLVVIAHP